MVHTVPVSTYQNAVVFYYWLKCPHCLDFMPTWQREIRREFLNRGIGVWEIDVEAHKSLLEQMSVTLGKGVPRLVFYNHVGEPHVYTGARSKQAIVLFGDKTLKGGGGGGVLKTVSPSFVDAHLPALVLYYRDNCGYCTRFKPTFTEFAGLSGVGTVVGVDTNMYRDAMSKLHPDASSPGVPHVVYHDAQGHQTPFHGERTVSELRAFLNRMQTPQTSRGVTFEGGGGGGGGGKGFTKGSASSRLTKALNTLQARAKRMLGERYTRVFEPENSNVTFVGMSRADVANNDRVYILFSPQRQPPGKPSAHACVYGGRTGDLTCKIYVDKDVKTLLRNKRSAGFVDVKDVDTNPYVDALNVFGYYVDV